MCFLGWGAQKRAGASLGGQEPSRSSGAKAANVVKSTLGVLGPAGQDKLSLHACDPRAMGVWASCWGHSKAGNGAQSQDPMP